MTVDDIKNLVPFDVQVKVSGTDYTGHVRGRSNAFATVYVSQLDADYEFSWAAVGRAHSNGVVLTA